MIEDNKIDFYGNPTAQGAGPKLLAYTRGPDGNIPLVTVLFAAAAMHFCSPSVASGGLLACSLVSGLISTVQLQAMKGVEVWSWRQKMPGMYAKTHEKIINLNPDKNTHATRPEWMRFAALAKEVHQGHFIAGSAIVVEGLCRAMITADSSTAIATVAVGGGCLVRAVMGVRRWSKVLSGKWVVEDAPKPLPVTAKAKKSKRLGVLVPGAAG